ncbi:MAG: glutamate-1-semialdehyde 2,1-aminomutase [bacterium]|nr:glutamate-1-semialdehyde 2,1-aminomutase [bacterium]
MNEQIIPYGRQMVDADDIAAVAAVLRSATIARGPTIAAFERALVPVVGTPHVVACSSGTAGLHLACLAAGIGTGDEVIVPAITFAASANCVAYCGAVTVFADVDPATTCVDVADVARKVTARTRAIIPVHFAGQSADMDAIAMIARDAERRFGKKVWIIEDACHTLGSVYRGQIIGACTQSDFAVFSFHPVKHITTGEGGAVTARDAALRDRIALLRGHGITKDPLQFRSPADGPWYHEEIALGYNYFLTDLQAALGISQLQKLPQFMARRRAIVAAYDAAFSGIPHLTPPTWLPDRVTNAHLYVLQCDFAALGTTRAAVVADLAARGVGTQVHYLPVYRHPYYRAQSAYAAVRCPSAEAYYDHCLTIPLFPAMSDDDVQRVIATVTQCIQHYSALPARRDVSPRTSASLDALLARRHDLIPGGAHTNSKGDDQFSANAPAAIVRGNGARVIGSDGVEYVDWCMGLRSVLLGHCYPAVQEAVRAQMDMGTNFGRPHVVEFELADLLTAKLPHADMVKFAKNGSTVTTAATKLARAFTGRKYIAACNQPFFSYDDWFIGTTACDAGVPEEIKGLTLKFAYNDLASVEQLFAEHPGEIACVIMEAMTTEDPAPGFLEGVRAITAREGALLIMDEMITGFRFGIGGAQARYKIHPDLSTYGKGIANGYSCAVLAGRRDVMELGGLHHDKPRVFLISTTHGAETIALAAAYAAIITVEREDVARHLWERGVQLQNGLRSRLAAAGLTDSIRVIGFPCNTMVQCTERDGTVSLVLKTILLQEMIKERMLFQGAFVLSFSHGDAEIAETLAAVERVLPAYSRALNDTAHRDRYLVGPAVKPVFRRYN